MMNKEFTVNIEWLKFIATKITDGSITITQAAKNAYIDTPNGTFIFSISESTLRSNLNKHSISYQARVGRPNSIITNEIEQIIINFQKELNSGETVTYHSIRNKYPLITSNDVHQTFLKFNLHQYKKDKKEVKIRCRYEALWVQQIWHADIHIFTDENLVQHYLYAIIDDRSRFITGYDILRDKSCNETIRVLNNAITTYGCPAIMWTDNGGENNGKKMLSFLKKHRIYPHFTFPRNPEQNGKAEAFWKKIDKCCRRISDIPNYIRKYNTIRAHTGLERNDNGILKRPGDVFFNNDIRWQRNFEWLYKVDGNIVPFPYNKDRKIIYYD
ncbi:hypothetical protein M9Y10_033776 [Tritrichomonas musculus]|uniref:Integrase catalytic domain-containing protein n=1 Tax=Tritrichomonas musculus TaxID=1915356 RepID=A0ABR2KDR4_9EUKA